jgi:hypothetical protein
VIHLSLHTLSKALVYAKRGFVQNSLLPLTPCLELIDHIIGILSQSIKTADNKIPRVDTLFPSKVAKAYPEKNMQ